MEVSSLEALGVEAARFVSSLKRKEGGATLVTLSGELGAGKTAFVQAAARTLGITTSITSPTFVLEKAYEIPRKTGEAGFARLVHIDAYRLEGGKDLGPLHFDELMHEADNLIMLEWPEKVSDALPHADVHISIETLPSAARRIAYD